MSLSQSISDLSLLNSYKKDSINLIPTDLTIKKATTLSQVDSKPLQVSEDQILTDDASTLTHKILNDTTEGDSLFKLRYTNCKTEIKIDRSVSTNENKDTQKNSIITKTQDCNKTTLKFDPISSIKSAFKAITQAIKDLFK